MNEKVLFGQCIQLNSRMPIAVLHVFQKKSKKGISIPKKEIDLVLNRLKQARIDYQEFKREK